MSKSQFLKLRNGAILCIGDIQAVIRKDLNQYVIIMRNCPAMPNADGTDVQEIERILDPIVIPYEAPKAGLVVPVDA